MKERLEMILEKYGISASKLAEILDVQRSGISHILAGRNNPSYDFLVRLLEHFSDIDANWLLSGEGKMLKNPENELLTEKDTNTQIPHIPESLTTQSKQDDPVKEEKISKEKPEVYKGKQAYSSPEDNISGLFILYSDGTFRRYKPE